MQQAVFQPVRQKAVLLVLFILRKHLVIRVLVARSRLSVGLKRPHFQHTHVVIGAHLDAL